MYDGYYDNDNNNDYVAITTTDSGEVSFNVSE